MNKLWIYGDSFSTDYTRKFLKLSGKTWYEYLSEYLNLSIENNAVNGHGILSVICQIIITQHLWEESDFIVVGLPDPFRIDIPQVNDSIIHDDLENDKGHKIKEISKKIWYNGTEWVDDNSINLWNNFSNIISHKNMYTFSIKNIGNIKLQNPLYNKSVLEYIIDNKLYISKEDYHLSPSGAFKFFELIVPKIKNNGN